MRGTASTLPVVGEKRGRRHGQRNCHRHRPDDVEDADSITLETSAASVAENGMAQSRRRRRDSAPGIDGDRRGQSNDLLRDGSRSVAESLEAIARPLFLSLVVVQSVFFSHHLAVTAASAATGGPRFFDRRAGRQQLVLLDMHGSPDVDAGVASVFHRPSSPPSLRETRLRTRRRPRFFLALPSRLQRLASNVDRLRRLGAAAAVRPGRRAAKRAGGGRERSERRPRHRRPGVRAHDLRLYGCRLGAGAIRAVLAFLGCVHCRGRPSRSPPPLRSRDVATALLPKSTSLTASTLPSRADCDTHTLKGFTSQWSTPLSCRKVRASNRGKRSSATGSKARERENSISVGPTYSSFRQPWNGMPHTIVGRDFSSSAGTGSVVSPVEVAAGANLA